MTQSLLLSDLWDLEIDVNGNIALASSDLSLAQDAACAIQTYQGECYFDTTLGVPYLQQVFGFPIPLALLKQLLVDAALSANSGIASAQVFITSLTNRAISGQVQVVSAATGEISVATFNVVNPQGVG